VNGRVRERCEVCMRVCVCVTGGVGAACGQGQGLHRPIKGLF
jgi:hypothetical protein